ncbi:hypothetical protein GCM10011321_03660 [Youhaiella tibetensis]|nr:hypothetical protein GCM10011321_03660 [Youhaiella tibetensis]
MGSYRAVFAGREDRRSGAWQEEEDHTPEGLVSPDGPAPEMGCPMGCRALLSSSPTGPKATLSRLNKDDDDSKTPAATSAVIGCYYDRIPKLK